MSRISEEISRYYGISDKNVVVQDMLLQSGVGHEDGGHSGRYPWGSGDSPYQNSHDWQTRVNYLRAHMHEVGMSENDIAIAMGCRSTKDLRIYETIAKGEAHAALVNRVNDLRKSGKGWKEIGDLIGKPESTVRSLADEMSQARQNVAKNTADFLREQLKTADMIDVTSGTELYLKDVDSITGGRPMNISRDKLEVAVYMLRNEGYQLLPRRVPQAGNPGKFTTFQILAKPGTAYKEVYERPQDIKSIEDFSVHSDAQGNDIFGPPFHYPSSMDPKRLAIRYAEEGGTQMDGVIELRPGVKDLKLGSSKYAQVRILVGGTHYLKGMAVYSDDLPEGVDVRFNTNKHLGTPPLGEDSKNTVLKQIKKKDPRDDNPNFNPFGSLIKERGGQSWYDENGETKLSLINKRSDEGDWGKWDLKVASQFLSKQNINLITKQLNETIADKQKKFDEIMSLTNPTVKRQLLEDFADECDGTATSLSCKGFPEQRWEVILPVPSMKNDEVFAPNYPDGTKLALVRYPHGGTFEIPILTVNNKNPEANQQIGMQSKDAIGINASVAERLSGADFDGDTVMTIPCNSSDPRYPRITSTGPLPGFENGFDAKAAYPWHEGMKEMKYVRKRDGKTIDHTQREMGQIANLLGDMQLAEGANPEHIAMALRHSMVVIDAAKHHLDYKQSEKDNHIKELKQLYQKHYEDDGKLHYGASTLISRSGQTMQVLKRTGQPWINKETGRKEWERINPKTGEFESKYVHEEYVDKHGKTKVRTQEVSALLEKRDAYQFVSEARSPKEMAYAKYANTLMEMADRARKEMVNTPRLEKNADAAKIYAPEVASLMRQLEEAERNRPRERMAQLATYSYVKALKDGTDDMTKEEERKLNAQALARFRVQFNAHRREIEPTEREWAAIQAGAISDTKLKMILNHANIDKIKKLAMPKPKMEISETKMSAIRAMASIKVNGRQKYSAAQIAEKYGISASAVQDIIS